MRTDCIVFIDLDGKPVPAGRLVITEDGRHGRATFAYGRRYLARPDALALDPVHLPLTEARFLSPPDFLLFNGIRDAAPDAWGRRLIDLHVLRCLGRPAQEQEFLLVSQGGNRPGALRFGPTPAGPGPVLPHGLPDAVGHLGDLEDLLALSDCVMSGARDIPGYLLPWIAPAADMGGARPKATVMIDGFPWLAKFPRPGDRIDMAAVEAACLDLCETAGIAVPRRRIETILGRRVLLVERFDRRLAENGVQRIPMISGLTLIGAHESDVGLVGYADLLDGLRRYGCVAGAGEQLFRRMVMNVLCGNTDDHLRNHAFLAEAGRWKLAPAYDITPTLQASTTRNLFLHLGRAGSGRTATLAAAMAGADALGLRREQAEFIAGSLSDMVAACWRPAMQGRGATATDIALLENSFSEAGQETDIAAPRPGAGSPGGAEAGLSPG